MEVKKYKKPKNKGRIQNRSKVSGRIKVVKRSQSLLPKNICSIIKDKTLN